MVIMNTINICANSGYMIITANKKQIRVAIFPAIKSFDKVVNFRKSEGLVDVQYTAKLMTGEMEHGIETIDLNDELSFIIKDTQKFIAGVNRITTNKEEFAYEV